MHAFQLPKARLLSAQQGPFHLAVSNLETLEWPLLLSKSCPFLQTPVESGPYCLCLLQRLLWYEREMGIGSVVGRGGWKQKS